jgi:hypothetical protein
MEESIVPRYVLVLIIVLGAALLVGCGGGNDSSTSPTALAATSTPTDRILHLGIGNLAQDITESAFRANEQSILLRPGGVAFCQGIRNLSDAEVFSAIAANPSNPYAATEIPPTDDDLRAAAIAKEECARILNGN